MATTYMQQELENITGGQYIELCESLFDIPDSILPQLQAKAVAPGSLPMLTEDEIEDMDEDPSTSSQQITTPNQQLHGGCSCGSCGGGGVIPPIGMVNSMIGQILQTAAQQGTQIIGVPPGGSMVIGGGGGISSAPTPESVEQDRKEVEDIHKAAKKRLGALGHFL